MLRLAGVDENGQSKAAIEMNAESEQPLSEYERSLLVHLGKFDEAVRQAASAYLPSNLAQYLFQLSQKYSAYQNDPILQADKGIKERRLELVRLSVAVLVRGLDLLGIEAPGEDVERAYCAMCG